MSSPIMRRAAAWLALVTLAAAIVVLVAGAVAEWAWVILGLAGWYAVSLPWAAHGWLCAAPAARRVRRHSRRRSRRGGRGRY